MKATRLTSFNKPRVIEAIKRAPETYFCTITAPKKTNAQIRLIHKWFSEIQTYFSENCGKAYTQDDIKSWLKDLFIEPELVEINGRLITKQISLADIECDKMRIFMEKIENYCSSELQIYLTVPFGHDDQM